MVNPIDVALLSDLPNPLTPMAFLAPEVAYRTTILGHVTVGGYSVLLWDLLTHLPADYRLVERHKITLPTAIYFLSRWSTLFYTTSSVIFQTAPVGNCAVALKITCTVYHVTTSSTALLFFFRVRAIFDKNRYITIIYFILWLSVLGGSLTAITALSGGRIGNTKYCTFSNIKAYRSAANITLAIFDTCVYIAITWRLLRNLIPVWDENSGRTHRRLPAFSKALLQDGQQYYMVAMMINLVVVIMEFAPGVPLTYRTMFLTTAVVLTNIMGCRVFRHTRMGLNKDTHTMSAIVFTKSNTVPILIPSRQNSATVCSNHKNSDEVSSSENTEPPSNIYHSPEKLQLHTKALDPVSV